MLIVIGSSARLKRDLRGGVRRRVLASRGPDQAAVDEVVSAGDVAGSAGARNVISVATSSGAVNGPVANPPIPSMIVLRAVPASTPAA
jgi:hypothetical protein